MNRTTAIPYNENVHNNYALPFKDEPLENTYPFLNLFTLFAINPFNLTKIPQFFKTASSVGSSAISGIKSLGQRYITDALEIFGSKGMGNITKTIIGKAIQPRYAVPLTIGLGGYYANKEGNKPDYNKEIQKLLEEAKNYNKTTQQQLTTPYSHFGKVINTILKEYGDKMTTEDMNYLLTTVLNLIKLNEEARYRQQLFNLNKLKTMQTLEQNQLISPLVGE